MIYGATIRSTIPRGDDRRAARRLCRRISRSPTHRDIPGQNYVALIDPDQPCLAERQRPPRRRADPAGRACRQARADRHRQARDDRVPDQQRRTTIPKRPTCASRRSRSTRAISICGFRECRCRDRRRVSHRPSGAALYRNQRRDRRARRRPDDGLRIAAVPLLRAQGAGRAAEAAARSRAGGADGNRRRLRRQGRVPVDPRVPRRDPRAQGRAVR